VPALKDAAALLNVPAIAAVLSVQNYSTRQWHDVNPQKGSGGSKATSTLLPHYSRNRAQHEGLA
jgi:hypothetical protein